MFKLAKYYLFINWYGQSKQYLARVLLSVSGIILSIFIFNDIIAMSDEKTIPVIFKWLVVIALLGIIAYNTNKAIKSISLPLQGTQKQEVPDALKEKILTQKTLRSRSERILDKYRENTYDKS